MSFPAGSLVRFATTTYTVWGGTRPEEKAVKVKATSPREAARRWIQIDLEHSGTPVYVKGPSGEAVAIGK